MSTKFRCRYLTENYTSDERVRRLVDTTDIFLVPSLNPDGYEEEDRCGGWQYPLVIMAYIRYNANMEDLNRAFPGWRDTALPRCVVLVWEWACKYENMKYWETFKISLKLPI